MSHSLLVHITFTELRDETQLSEDILHELIELGIVQPHGAAPDDWVFEAAMVSQVRRAWRLHRDLGINWSGVALALELLEEREQLLAENRSLRRQLQRFLWDE